MKKPCKQCNKEFNGRSNAYYCGGNCRKLAFKHSLETVAESVAKISATDKLATDTVTVSETPNETPTINNWQRLQKRFPDKIKSKQDALRYAAHCILQSIPEAILIIGDVVYGLKGTQLEAEQPNMLSFK